MASHDIVTREQQKFTALEMSKTYSVKDIATEMNIDVSEVRRLQEEALHELQQKNEELGRAYAALILDEAADARRIMNKFINKFSEHVTVTVFDNEDGEQILSQASQDAADIVFKAIDRMDKLHARASKILGLDAPIKLQPVGGGSATPDAIVNAAMEFETELPSSPEEEDFAEKLLPS